MNSPSDFESDQTTDELLEAITELQQNVKENIKRSDMRFSAECGVAVTPGSISQRGADPIVGTCHDISANGCRVVLDSPVLVGDVFLLQFDQRTFRLDPSFCRCVRCIMMREEKFECGFSFFSPVSLPKDPTSTELL